MVKAHGWVQAICLYAVMETCMHKRCLCSKGRGSDGEFKTLLNNLLSLHSAVDVCIRKSAGLALLECFSGTRHFSSVSL